MSSFGGMFRRSIIQSNSILSRIFKLQQQQSGQRFKPIDVKEYVAFRYVKGRSFLGLDVGSKFIGLSVSDTDGKIAAPLNVLIRTGNNTPEIGKALMEFAAIYSSQAVVVGIPIYDPEQTSKILQYMSEVWESCNISLPVLIQDESKTTYEVVAEATGDLNVSQHQMVRKLNKYGKSLVDALCAAKILQRFLDQTSSLLKDPPKIGNSKSVNEDGIALGNRKMIDRDGDLDFGKWLSSFTPSPPKRNKDKAFQKISTQMKKRDSRNTEKKKNTSKRGSAKKKIGSSSRKKLENINIRVPSEKQ